MFSTLLKRVGALSGVALGLCAGTSVLLPSCSSCSTCSSMTCISIKNKKYQNLHLGRKIQAYKLAENNGERIILTLEIPEDALTNMGRSNIVDADKALYRTNKVKVLKAEDSKGNEYKIATSLPLCADRSYYEEMDEKREPLIYSVGDVIEYKCFDTDIELPFARGIKFFLNKKMAEVYMCGKPQNGRYQNWSADGSIYTDVMIKDGRMGYGKIGGYEPFPQMITYYKIVKK